MIEVDKTRYLVRFKEKYRLSIMKFPTYRKILRLTRQYTAVEDHISGCLVYIVR